MQKDHPETPKQRRIRRVCNSFTPELEKKNTTDAITNARPGHSRQRTTMAPSDFASVQIPSRKKIGLDRTSIFHSQTMLEGTRVMDMDNDMELKLLYDQYLQKIMTELILKQKIVEKKKLFLSQLATIAKECEHNEEKLFKLKIREKDIINLTEIQNDLDSQIIDINNHTKGENIETLQTILSQLHSLLQPLDVLRCNNMILPETPEEWEETTKILKSCSKTLKSIMDLIGPKYESYQSVNDGLKEFVNNITDIKDHYKRLAKELNNLQALVLKIASLTLMQTHN